MFPHLRGKGGEFDIMNSSFEGKAKLLDKTSSINKVSFHDQISNTLVKLIDASESEVMIQNPYVYFTPEVLAALERAQARGVSLILHTNSPLSTDENLTLTFLIDSWDDYLSRLPTMRIFSFSTYGRKMHSKVFVFDRQLVMLGSFNLDPLSQNINSEIETMVQSDSVVTNFVEAIEKDISQSIELTADSEIRLHSPIIMADEKVKRKMRVIMRFKKLLGKYI